MKTKEKNKFNRGHFPRGTIVTIDPTVSNGIVNFEVLNLIGNGANSWVIETKTPYKCSDDMNYSFNIDWVTGILKRGDLPPLTQPEPTINEYFFAENRNEISPKKNSSNYYCRFHSLILFKLLNYGSNEDHLYDTVKLESLILKQLPPATKPWGNRLINKKRFHKAFEAALPRCKVSRKKTAKEEHRMEYDFMNDDFDASHHE